MTDITVPDDLSGAGLELWNKLHSALDFTMTEQQIAVELCRTVALCEVLAQRLETLGPVVDGQRGIKVYPIAAELRQQRLVAARLAQSLNIPPPCGKSRGRGGVRGVYVGGVK